MTDTSFIDIAGVVVSRIFYMGQPVLTFAMVDEIHQRPEGTAKRTFSENRERFVEGEDFVEAPFDAFGGTLGVPPKNLGSTLHVEPNGRGGNRRPLILITRRGYLKLVKPMRDDRAWEVQGEMIDRYFLLEELLAGAAPDLDEIADDDGTGDPFTGLSGKSITLKLRAVEAAISTGGPTYGEYVWNQVLADLIQLPGMKAPPRKAVRAEEGRACLAHILGFELDGATVDDHLRNPSKAALRMLSGLGLRPMPTNRLFVSNRRHSALFHGSRWAGNLHQAALRAIPGAHVHQNPLTLNGLRSRGVIVPLFAEVAHAAE